MVVKSAPKRGDTECVPTLVTEAGADCAQHRGEASREVPASSPPKH